MCIVVAKTCYLCTKVKITGTMRNDASKNILNLIQLLLDGNDYGLDEICEKLSISRRNFYYLAGFLRENGFDVFKSENKSYHIDRRSPWIAKIAESMRLTDDELTTLRSLLIMVGNGNGPINSLRQKFEAAYNITKVDSVPEMRRQNMILRKLTNAIQHKFTVRLIDYSSPHSHTVKDRIVEPFLMMNSNRDVRCYELTTSMNKTFKVARIADVEVLTDHWTNEADHRQIYTDIFMFSGEQHYTVRLRLGLLAHNLFLEEYPQASRNIKPDGDDPSHWILELVVCDYRGVGRFVIGLYDDIEVLGCDSFKDYIREKIEKMYNKNNLDKTKE